MFKPLAARLKGFPKTDGELIALFFGVIIATSAVTSLLTAFMALKVLR
jgi:hypothetical protein